MCELLAMSANVPTDICFSFSGLLQRGGHTGPHRDGWGIAFYDGPTTRLFIEPHPSSHSPFADAIRKHPIKSETVISHIRQANSGRVCLENTHPFTRELWGRQWVFAHNGQFKRVKQLPLGDFHPIGTTDSEHAFCWLLNELKNRFPSPPSRPSTLWRFIAQRCKELNQFGIFNALISDSRYLYAHCSNHLCMITRRAPFGAATLIDAELAVDFKKETTPNDIVTVIATTPLTNDEEWGIMAPGDFYVFRKGLEVWKSVAKKTLRKRTLEVKNHFHQEVA